MINAECEHSALSAAIGSEAVGIRTFTASASQGLALMHEILFVTSGLRMPVVMAVANRALSAPINIWNDQQDSVAERDSGWVQFYVESAQEAFDTVIQAYKVAENRKVMLPVMVCLDGYIISHVHEPVDFPEQEAVDRFLPPYRPRAVLDPKKPVTIGPIGFPDSYMYFKEQQHQAMKNALQVIKTVNSEFKKSFGRGYGDGLIESYRTSDAKCAIVAMGSVCGTIRNVVDELRKKGRRVGMVKVRTFRPFPATELAEACSKLKAIAVIDKNISFGQEGALFSELKSALFRKRVNVFGYIAGLGGRDITPNHIKRVFNNLGKTKATARVRWLF
jgi:pyruvate ferredoxin oxidoreductase alpha subunit